MRRRVKAAVAGRGSGAPSLRVALLPFLVMAALFALAFAPAAQDAKGVIGFFGNAGTLGGQFNSPRGVAVNPSTGTFDVADSANNRIQQFSATGAFIRAWGWDLVRGANV